MKEFTSQAEYEAHCAAWGEHGPTKNVLISEQSYPIGGIRTNIALGGVSGNVPKNYVEHQKYNTFVKLPPARKYNNP